MCRDVGSGVGWWWWWWWWGVKGMKGLRQRTEVRIDTSPTVLYVLNSLVIILKVLSVYF